ALVETRLGTPCGAPATGWSAVSGLLDRDSCAGALKLLLGLVGGVLVDLLENGLRRAVDEVLGLLETERRERADLLDDLDLLVAGGLQDDVELGLLLGGCLHRGALGSGRPSSGDRDGRGGRNLEGLLELLHELGELDQGHLLERIKELVGAQLRHGGGSFRWWWDSVRVVRRVGATTPRRPRPAGAAPRQADRSWTAVLRTRMPHATARPAWHRRAWQA